MVNKNIKYINIIVKYNQYLFICKIILLLALKIKQSKSLTLKTSKYVMFNFLRSLKKLMIKRIIINKALIKLNKIDYHNIYIYKYH